jgi:site-specific recombinase XerD
LWRYCPLVSGEAWWQVFWAESGCWWGNFAADPVVQGVPGLAEVVRRNGTRAGQPFLVRSDGVYPVTVNAFLASARMRGCAEGTRRKYAIQLSIWLGFLDAVGCCWSDATADQVGAFKFWRINDERNPCRVTGGTFRGGLVAINAFYEWAERRYGVMNPVERVAVPVAGGRRQVDSYRAAPRVGRDRDVKWLDPGGFTRWRDVGLCGLDLSGRELSWWRGRSPQRDCAFVGGLYGTGLRLTEWASMLVLELPFDASDRAFVTGQLAAACAKGGVRRKYWMPYPALSAVLSYGEGERAAAVRRAQAVGRYDGVADRLVVRRQLGGRRIEVVDVLGRSSAVSLDALSPQVRRRLFRETASGLEPVALWLNTDGAPRVPHGWQHTFVGANARVARAGLVGLTATAHMLRHSFALRWFSVGRLLYEKRFAHLDLEEMRDFRAQFGDTWFFVMTLLGHRSVATTMNVYLEPFRDLDVELLIAHAHGAAMSGLLAEMFAAHPLVRTDPVGASQR